MEYARGVDLSVYQWYRDTQGRPVLSTPVDFRKMKAAGIVFAYVRATTILGEPDYAFELNWQGLKDVGIARGAYGFANNKDPVGYARRMYEIVQDTGDLGELPPALDYECKYIAATKSYIGKMTWQACHDWLLHMEACDGRRPITYSSWEMWFRPPPPWTPNYQFWVASYAAKGDQPKWMPAGVRNWLFWQQGTPAIGKKLGVCSEEIDVDVFNGNEDSFRAWAGLVHMPTLDERVTALELAVFGKGG
jgi:lysozyme